MSEVTATRPRKADFWFSLVLIAGASAMLLEALTFPLRGTYAGVSNAWYVSPALFPLIISTILILLAVSLLIRSVRAGGAKAALADIGQPAGRLIKEHAAFWLVGGAIGAYVYGFVPHVDFVAATASFLLCFTAAFHLQDVRAGWALLATFILGGVILLGVGLLGLTPSPRTASAYLLDSVVWAAYVAAAVLAARATRSRAGLRRDYRQCLGTSVVTAFLLGAVFKYGLLVPLPREGLTVALMDEVVYALRAAF